MFLDSLKTFDTVNHDILLSKLYTVYGIRGTSFKWFRSYLCNGTQFVHWYIIKVDRIVNELEHIKLNIFDMG